ncbi:hypothetical protein P5673_028898, partial [Acropora cervicornis]
THSLELTIKHTYQPLTSTGDEYGGTPGVSVETVRQEPSRTPDEQQQVMIPVTEITFVGDEDVSFISTHQPNVGADFEAYAEQLDFFFVANGVTDSKQKKAVLLTNLSTET